MKSGKYNTFNSEYVGDKNLKNCSASWFLIVKYYCELLSNIWWNKNAVYTEGLLLEWHRRGALFIKSEHHLHHLLVNFCSTWMKIQWENGHEICMLWKKNDNKTVE